jgi:hypothetical protein
VVSGSLSSPNRGSSHLSVALLFTIGCQGVLSLGRWASQIQTAFHVSSPTRVSAKKRVVYKYGAVTLFGSAFLRILLTHVFMLQTPRPHSAVAEWFRLIPVRSPLLRKSSFLFFPTATEMFQLTALASNTYGFGVRSFGNLGINACLTASPSLSQPSTPFIAS